jgi:hypothetical protein
MKELARQSFKVCWNLTLTLDQAYAQFYQHSSLSEEDKVSARNSWDQQWKKFLNWLMQNYSQERV